MYLQENVINWFNERGISKDFAISLKQNADAVFRIVDDKLKIVDSSCVYFIHTDSNNHVVVAMRDILADDSKCVQLEPKYCKLSRFLQEFVQNKYNAFKHYAKLHKSSHLSKLDADAINAAEHHTTYGKWMARA